MCEHEFICPNCNGNGYLELHAMGPEKCNVCRGKGVAQSMPTNLIANLEKALLNDLYQQLAAAKAELAAEREKATTDTFAGQTWVTFSEHMKALNKIKQMEDAIKFDFERFMDFQRRAEQAEAQCAAMRNCHNCKNYDMQWDNDGDWVQRCKHNDTEHDACGKLMKWEAEGNG